jgi:AcrR family transcriptional regulator
MSRAGNPGNASPPLPGRRSADSATSQSVIEVALETVYQLGFHRASANVIAQRAGVTWGVIQYYFGTRQGLLLAAANHVIDKAVRQLEMAEITGSSAKARLSSFAQVYFEVFGGPELLAVNEIVWGLAREPETQGATRATLASWIDQSDRVIAKLLGEISPKFKRNQGLASFAIFALYGVAYAHQASPDLYRLVGLDGRKPDLATQRRYLVDALASLLI